MKFLMHMEGNSSDNFYFNTAIQCVLYLLENSTSSNIVDISNMIFLADKYHLQRYGRAITKDVFHVTADGIIPAELYNTIISTDLETMNMVSEYVNTKNISNLVAKKKHDYMVFSETDVEVMDEVISVVNKENFDLTTHITQLSLWEKHRVVLPISNPIERVFDEWCRTINIITIDDIFDCNDDGYFKVDNELRELNKSCYHEDEEIFASIRGITVFNK